jgi:hypothetical protein
MEVLRNLLRNDTKALDLLVPAARTHKDAGKRGGRGKKATGNTHSFNHGSAAAIVARLKRDRPDLAAQLAAGEFKSARAAARAAGSAG